MAKKEESGIIGTNHSNDLMQMARNKLFKDQEALQQDEQDYTEYLDSVIDTDK